MEFSKSLKGKLELYPSTKGLCLPNFSGGREAMSSSRSSKLRLKLVEESAKAGEVELSMRSVGRFSIPGKDEKLDKSSLRPPELLELVTELELAA